MDQAFAHLILSRRTTALRHVNLKAPNKEDSFRSLAGSQAGLRGPGGPASTSERIG
jgi:hypothetical protein